MDFIIAIISFVIALGILVTVHEFGHFWVARKCGVKVLRFSVGFGKPLFIYRRKNDPTEYVVAGIPLGGYVKMLDENDGNVAESEKHLAFNRQSLSKRIAIVAAGPIFNLLFAVFAFWIILTVGERGIRPIIAEPIENTIAAQAQFEMGDEITEVNKRPTPIWRVAVGMITSNIIENGSVDVTVKTIDGRTKSLFIDFPNSRDIEPNKIFEHLGLHLVSIPLLPIIDHIVEGEPADIAGLQKGDLILTTNGDSISSWSEWVKVTRASPQQTLLVDVERQGQVYNLQLRPKLILEGTTEIGRIGASVLVPEDALEDYYTTYSLGLVPGLIEASQQTYQYSILTLKMIGRMIIGEASVDNLSGPISLAKYAGQTASYGVISFLKFLAFVSVSLGVLNLLPIPMLDGGHLVFYFIEALRGKAVSKSTQEAAMRTGLMILMSVMLLALFVDLTRIST